MARARSGSNGNGKLDKLDEAMTSLIQAQAHLVQIQAATQAQIAQSNAQIAATNADIAESRRQQTKYERLAAERFARIESILLEHSRILQALPEAVREKIGFRPPQQT
jgi:hypothetical protein